MKAMETISKSLRVTFMLIACGMVAACQTPGPVKDTAALVGSYTNTFTTQLTNFSTASNQDRQQNAQRVADMELEAIFAMQEVTQERQKLDLEGNTIKLQAFDKLQAAATSLENQTPSDVQIASQLLESRKTAYGKVSYDPKKLQSIIKVMQQLTTNRSLKDQVTFAVSFGQQVNKGMNQASKDSSNKTKEAASTADKAKESVEATRLARPQ
jgi:hypothetical protein